MKKYHKRLHMTLILGTGLVLVFSTLGFWWFIRHPTGLDVPRFVRLVCSSEPDLRTFRVERPDHREFPCVLHSHRTHGSFCSKPLFLLQRDIGLECPRKEKLWVQIEFLGTPPVSTLSWG